MDDLKKRGGEVVVFCNPNKLTIETETTNRISWVFLFTFRRFRRGEVVIYLPIHSSCHEPFTMPSVRSQQKRVEDLFQKGHAPGQQQISVANIDGRGGLGGVRVISRKKRNRKGNR